MDRPQVRGSGLPGYGRGGASRSQISTNHATICSVVSYIDYPATSIQRQFWLTEQLHPGNRAYNVASLFSIRGQLDANALELAFQDVIARHDALRTLFIEIEGQLFQRVLESVRCSIPSEVIERDARFGCVESEIQQRFDLSRGPLIRGRLWRLDETEHLFALTMHHIVTDLASKDILGRDLSQAFAARVRGGAGAASIAASQYSDYVAWLQTPSRSEHKSRAIAYFRQQIDLTNPPLDIPTDRARPRIQSLEGDCVDFDLTLEDSRAIESLARELTSDPFLILLTLYAVLLARYARQAQVTIGVPLTNRTCKEAQDACGCFVNNLPVCVSTAGDPTFESLLRQIRMSMLGNHRHQELPFEELVAALNPERDAGRNPIFQAGFTFEPPMSLTLAGTQVVSHKVHCGGAQLDIFLVLWKRDGRYCGQLEYATALYDRSSAERMSVGFVSLVRSLLHGGSSQQVRHLDILGPEQSELVTKTWNATHQGFDGPELMHRRFEVQAAHTPEACALSLGSRSMSYRELDARANDLAQQLAGAGVGRSSRVGIIMERSFEMVIAIYATLKAGAAYLPLDPAYPEERLRFVISDSAPAVVLMATSSDATHLPENCQVQRVDLSRPVDFNLKPPMNETTPDDAAYAIYTSGSTGVPKGVPNSHRGISNRIAWMQDAFQLCDDDVILQKTPYTFDVSTWEFFWPLTCGARLEIAPPESHRDPDLLVRLVNESGVTTLHFVPSMLQAFIEHPQAGRCRGIRRVICSGEALPSQLVRQFHEVIPDAELHNLYGPTEAAVDVTWWKCTQENHRDPIPIGRPIANTTIYVLDECFQPAPIGVPGELCIGGVQVALGYINRPELNAERFVRDPFCGDEHGRLYRTGDLARWTTEGVLEYLGRLDHQIKLRGLRIEPGEIETILSRHGEVSQCVVTAHTFATGEAGLVAYYSTSDSSGDADARAVRFRAFLETKLPSFMVPSHFVRLAELPLSSNGKIDRKALPGPEVVRPSARRIPPEGDLELAIQSLWSELLHISEIGSQDSFFELGGNSLLCVRMLGRLRSTFDLELPLVVAFENPTVESLARHIEHLLAGSSTNGTPSQNDDLSSRAQKRAEQRRNAIRRSRRSGRS